MNECRDTCCAHRACHTKRFNDRRRAQKEAHQYRPAEWQARRATARYMHTLGYKLREIGAVLGISAQRAHTLTQTTET